MRELPVGGGTQRRAETILLMLTVIWGATFSIAKYLVDSGVEPVAVVAWRFGIAAIVFLAFFRGRLGGVPRRITVVHGAILGILLYLGFGLQTVGLGQTSSSRSGFITALYVIFTPLLQLVISRRSPGRRVLIGILLVLLGLWGLTAPGGDISGLIDPWRTGGFNFGDSLTLACAFFFAIYIVLLQRYTRDGQINALTAMQLVVVAVVALLHLGIAGAFGGLSGAVAMPTTVVAWAGLLYLALFASVVSTYLQTRYQRDTTPSRAAIIFTLESVFAAAIAAIALGERLTLLSLAGGALIVAGLLVVELGGAPPREVESDPEDLVPTAKESATTG